MRLLLLLYFIALIGCTSTASNVRDAGVKASIQSDKNYKLVMECTIRQIDNSEFYAERGIINSMRNYDTYGEIIGEHGGYKFSIIEFAPVGDGSQSTIYVKSVFNEKVMEEELKKLVQICS